MKTSREYLDEYNNGSELMITLLQRAQAEAYAAGQEVMRQQVCDMLRREWVNCQSSYMDLGDVIANDIEAFNISPFPHHFEGEVRNQSCETCNDDPYVCASVPSLRHCEKANREK